MSERERTKPGISVFYPVFNDWGTIGSLVLSTINVLDRVSTHPMSRIEELLPDRWKPLEGADPPGRKG